VHLSAKFEAQTNEEETVIPDGLLFLHGGKISFLSIDFFK
jgi:hypothetical protein